MKPPTKPSPIIGSFEDIGSDVIRETKQVATDVGGKILESLTGAGSSAKGKPTGQFGPGEGGGMSKKQDGALGAMEETKDMDVKRAIARAALQQLAGGDVKEEPSVWEEKQREEKEQQAARKNLAQKQALSELPVIKTKKRRGDLYGIKGKSSSEMSKNVRQD